MIDFEPAVGATPAIPLAPSDDLVVDPRFHAQAAWSALTPDQAARIGAAALDLVVAWNCRDHAEDLDHVLFQHPLDRVGSEAEHQATEALLRAFVAAIPREDACAAAGQPLIPASIGMVCRRCGCSEDDACAAGCGWAQPGLCTACVPSIEAATDG